MIDSINNIALKKANREKAYNLKANRLNRLNKRIQIHLCIDYTLEVLPKPVKE